jgi:multicomponent Na+:H+ antiporter subunit B
MMEAVIDIVLLTFIAVLTVAVALGRDLFSAVMLFGIFSLLAAGLFLTMDAPDVALTEAAVGAGIATLLFLATLSLTGKVEKPREGRRLLPLAVVIVTGAALVWGTLDMPRFGDPDNPAQVHVAPRYLVDSAEEIGIPNTVASVLASYRAFDTFGEVVVIFAALLGVMMLIGGRKRHRRRKERGL